MTEWGLKQGGEKEENVRGEDGRGHIASRNTEYLPCTDAEPLDVRLAHKPFRSCVVTGGTGN